MPKDTDGRSQAPDAVRTGANAEYYAGIADALDVLRGIDFPLTERVDALALALAPSSSVAVDLNCPECRGHGVERDEDQDAPCPSCWNGGGCES